MSLPPSSEAEAQLVARLASGDGDAMEAVYTAYSRQVFSMAYGILRDYAAAEDVTQAVFETLWVKAGTYDPARGPFKHWFLHLAHNCCIDRLRSRRRTDQRHVQNPFDEVLLDLESPEDTAAAAVHAVLFGEVQKALTALPEEQRTALVMAYLHGATQQEIAERTGAPLGTVKTRLRLGLAKLRGLLAQPEREEA